MPGPGASRHVGAAQKPSLASRGPRWQPCGSRGTAFAYKGHPIMAASDLELIALTKHYGNAVAVDGIDLKIGAGSYCCLLGPSGCGKTSTLRMIAGHEVAVGGDDGARRTQHHPPAARRARHGDDVPELRAVPAPQRARQRGLQPAACAASPRVDARGPGARSCWSWWRWTRYAQRKPAAALGRPAAAGGAGARADHRAARAAAGRAALGARPVPAREDARRAAALAEELGLTFMHVTHSQEEAMALADLVVVMNHGRIEQAGSPHEVFNRPAHRVRGALHGRPQRDRHTRGQGGRAQRPACTCARRPASGQPATVRDDRIPGQPRAASSSWHATMPAAATPTVPTTRLPRRLGRDAARRRVPCPADRAGRTRAHALARRRCPRAPGLTGARHPGQPSYPPPRVEPDDRSLEPRQPQDAAAGDRRRRPPPAAARAPPPSWPAASSRPCTPRRRSCCATWAPR